MNGMTVNISSLGNLASAEPLDLDLYEDAKEVRFELPKTGRYQVRAPDSFPETAFGATKAGFLSATIDPEVTGPTNAGFRLRFTRISAKTYERGGKRVSQVGDYLRACGVTGTIPAAPQAIADAIAATAGRTYEVELDWEVNHFASEFQLKGMRNFPTLPDGSHQSWVEHPTERASDGTPLRLRANLVVRRFVPAA